MLEAAAPSTPVRSRRLLELRRILRGPRIFAIAEVVTVVLMLGTAIGTYFLVRGENPSYALLTPPIVALLLVVNLVPAIAALVLLGRRVALRRAARSAIASGSGRATSR